FPNFLVPSCAKTYLHRLPYDPNVGKEWMNFIFNEDPDCFSKNLVLCSLHSTVDLIWDFSFLPSTFTFHNHNPHCPDFHRPLILSKLFYPS
uniref:Uncharacterized protein n=1 Tax=Cyprinus carpio TaxID=7962 RepID=A0A8C2IBA2_CYPCA